MPTRSAKKSASSTPSPAALPRLPYQTIAQQMLEWFRPEARPMPWRATSPQSLPRSPYGIWISESMLQQTQVSTVIPYWERWMKKWPDIASLAQAQEEEIIRLWEGLGYYNRARNVLKTAQILVRDHQGIFPSDRATLLTLPGIGPYTAGAICSIAFNQPSPIVDGNIIRVLCRILTLSFNDASSKLKTRDLIWQISQELVQQASLLPHPQACSYFNQSMMDLGATLCTPLSPTCLLCPLRNVCKAYQEGTQGQYPQPALRPSQKLRQDIALLVQNEKKQILIQKRISSERNNRGFWQLPLLENTTLEEAPALFAQKGLNLLSPHQVLAQVLHHITHHTITVQLYRGSASAQLVLDETMRFVSPKELESLPVTTSQRKLLQILQKTTPATLLEGRAPTG